MQQLVTCAFCTHVDAASRFQRAMWNAAMTTPRCFFTPWSSPPLRRSFAARCVPPRACAHHVLTTRFVLQDIQDAFKGLAHFADEAGDAPSVHKYNELATLMHVSGAWQRIDSLRS